MSLFSQRSGIQPLSKALQEESLDEGLRNSLWNALCLCIWRHWSPPHRFGLEEPDSSRVDEICQTIWVYYFKAPIDSVPESGDSGYENSIIRHIRNYFFECEWWQALDLVEFLIKVSPDRWRKDLVELLNGFLEAENSAYRVLGCEITRISDPVEVAAVESALQCQINAIRTHIDSALSLASDRKEPDYRNSIKESISAVEAACQLVAGEPGKPLGDALKSIGSRWGLHKAMTKAFLSLYGYTSDHGGIRHALTEDSVEVTHAEAKLMLVTASALVNFLLEVAAHRGIDLEAQP